MCTHSHTVVALFSLLSHNHIIKKSLSYIFTILSHSYNFLTAVCLICGTEASGKSKLPVVLPRDVLVLSPSCWQFWQINAMSFDWRKSVLLIPNKEIEQIMIH